MPNRVRSKEFHVGVSVREKAWVEAVAKANHRPLNAWMIRVALGLDVAPQGFVGDPDERRTDSLHLMLTSEERDQIRARADGPVAPWLRRLLLGDKVAGRAPRRPAEVAQ